MGCRVYYKLFIMLLSFQFSFCTGNELKKKSENDKGADSLILLPKYSSDTIFYRDIPPGRNGYSYPYYLAKEIVSKTRSVDIENGFDSLFIRFLFHVSFDNRLQIVEIFQKSGKWECRNSFYIKEYLNDSKTYSLNSKVNLKPKTNWNSFINKILKLNIMKLPDQSLLPSAGETPSDTNFVTIEFATKSMYKIYSYGSLWYFPNVKEVQEVKQILTELENEFGIGPFEKI